MASETNPPSVSWAQRSATVIVIFNVQCDKPDIKIDNKSLYFAGKCGPEDKLHEVNIPLYAEVNPEKSIINNKGRYIEVLLAKEKIDQPFWPSLTNDKKKHHWLKVDFNRWQDEDETDDELDGLKNNMFNNLQFDEKEDASSSSAEEEDLPDLE